MKSFDTHQFDPKACQIELNEYKILLDTIKEPKEADPLLPLFKRCRNLTSLVGNYVPGIQRVDRIAYELSIAGDFTCDLVVGDSNTNMYCLIELEDADANSIFKRAGNKATRDWSTGVLLIGRHNLMEPEEETRLKWRVDKVLVDSNKVFCVPYDNLYDYARVALSWYDSAYLAGR